MKHFLLPLLLLTSCGSLKEDEEPEDKKEEKATGPKKRIIGRIASVSRAGEFVLIQKFGPGALPKNTIYQSQGPAGRSASLKPSGERVRDFYAADLVSGNVEKGDAVVGYPDHQKGEETEKTDEFTPISYPSKIENLPKTENSSLETKIDKEPQTTGLSD